MESNFVVLEKSMEWEEGDERVLRAVETMEGDSRLVY